MAAHGYELERFQSPVNRRYYCPICLNVLKDPFMCRNEHPFCRDCIIRHLTNDQRCPACMDELTLDTLTKPSRLLTELLSELRIRCEFVERGCEEFVQLQYLEKHVEKCGYAPVPCSNEGCQLEVNRHDLIYHESLDCEERQLKCHNCERLSEDVAILKQKVTRMEKKFDITSKSVAAVEEKLASFQKSLKEHQDSFQKSLKEQQDSFQKSLKEQNSFLKSLKEQQKNVDDSLSSLKRSNSSIKNNLKKLMEVMGSLPKKSRTETDNDDYAHDSSSSTSTPSRARSVDIQSAFTSSRSTSGYSLIRATPSRAVCVDIQSAFSKLINNS
ncbi:RING finger 151-like [Paramuricea clavata]|uniref:RING finger 151-like n=1 Tax=Paramuricea clavata TaxID=317549 RepID=A0A7D9JZD3_PARCT|nr:RING finger 151-like [Paramuricea clavata]